MVRCIEWQEPPAHLPHAPHELLSVAEHARGRGEGEPREDGELRGCYLSVTKFRRATSIARSVSNLGREECSESAQGFFILRAFQESSELFKNFSGSAVAVRP